MEAKNFIHFEVVKENRCYTFQLPVGGSFGEAYDACFQVLEQIMEMSKKAVDAAKPVVDGEVTNGEKQS